MKTTKIRMTFWVGDKKLNEFWRGLDLGSEGVYYKEVSVMTFKKPRKLTAAEKKKIISGITNIYERGGKETRDFKFENIDAKRKIN